MTTELTLSDITVTIPALGDSANIVTAFTDYHTDMAAAVAVLGRATNTFTGDIAVNGGDFTTTATTFNLIDSNATTVNFAGAGTGITIGASGSGTTTLRNTTVAMAGAATVGTTLSVTGNTTLTGDLAVNGGDLTSSAATFNLVNTNATTLNIGGAATTITVGAGTGNVNFNDNISAEGYITARRATNQDSVRLIGRAGGTGNYDAIITTDTLTATRTLTLPNATTTLVGTDVTQTLTNKTLTTPDINAGTVDSLTSLSVRDTSAAYDVTLAATSSTALTAGRTLTIDLVNAARTLKLGANISANAALTINSNAVTIAGASGGSSVTLPASGTLVNSAVTTLSSLASIGTVTTGTWNGSVISGQYGGTGVANTGKTITVSGNTTIGSSTHTVAFATSGNTSVTLPTSGTLAIKPSTIAISSTVTDSISTTGTTTKTSAALGSYISATANTAYKVNFAIRFQHSVSGPGGNGDASISFRFALPSGATIGADLDYRLKIATAETSGTQTSVYESSSIDILVDSVSGSSSGTLYSVIRGSGIIRVGATAGDIGPTIYLTAGNLGGPTSSASFTTAADSYFIAEAI